jgi:acetyl esterase/lipase
MKTIFKLISYLSAFFGLWTLIRSPKGIPGGIVWLPKLWASAWAPLWAFLGALGAVSGLLRQDWRAVLPGALGAVLSLRHIRRVTRPHTAFESAFGPGWEARIPTQQRARLPAYRYRLVQPASPDVPWRHDVILGKRGKSNQPLLADLWNPPIDTPHSGLGLIFLHGSLWQAVDKDFFTRPLFRRLAAQGHIIMDVAYSLAPQADLQAMMYDVNRAIAWMKEHAPETGVNPQHLVLMGQSGGGHLALLAAYAPTHPAYRPSDVTSDASVCGVVSFYGITDMVAFFHEYGQSNPRQPEYSSQITNDLRPRLHDATPLDRWLTRARLFPAYRHANMPGGPLLLVYLLGGTLAEAPESYRLASPLAHVGPQCPPTLQIFDEQDFVIDPSHGRRLHQALTSAGVTSVYIEFPECVHGFDNYLGVSRRVAPAAQAATYDLERFLALLV